MKAVVVASNRTSHQQQWGEAFATGLRRHGIDAEVSISPDPADLQVFWGVRSAKAIAAQKSSEREICILERGYVWDRFSYTSVSFGGGLNGRGQFRGDLRDPSRWNKHFAHLMQPWRDREGYALIVGQVPADMSLAGLRPRSIWAAVADQLRDLGYHVRFRPHPQAQGIEIHGTDNIGGTLQEAFDGASLVVGINSNATLDAVLAGIPTVTLDDRAMAWPVTGHDVSERIMPDRTAWATALAWKQWTMSEMESGECWAHVGEPAYA